jgi:hypothetical protein
MYNHTPPIQFLSPEARPNGYGKALSFEYTEWSNSNPEHSRDEGQKKYKEIAKRLGKVFPTFREIINHNF